MNEFDKVKEIGNILGIDELVTIYRYALSDPQRFSDMKKEITHGIPNVYQNEDGYIKIRDLIIKLDESRRATALKCLNGCRKSSTLISKERNEHKKPPAFDTSLRHDTSPEIIDSYLGMSDIPNTCCHDMIQFCRKELSKSLSILSPLIRLTNGSSTRIVDNGININDVLSIAFADPNMVARFPKLIHFLGIENFEYEYIEIDDKGQGGDHLLLADKEYKTREVYRMTSTVQVISKAIHIILDRLARKLPGNYTYNQMGYIDNLLIQGWNRKGILISTDMSKYSDTLDRNFMIELLIKIGFPSELRNELNDLYSLPIKDNYSTIVWSGTKASYQGQYGDFPMITIANLYLQCVARDRLGFHNFASMKYTNAAVGDDTCFYFPYGEVNHMMDIIIDTYGGVGVNINRAKTHTLVDGEGMIDFVKRNVDASGLISYVIPNLIASGVDKSDLGVNEVFRYYRESRDLETSIKLLMVDGWNHEEAVAIMNLNRLNGGVQDRPITIDDIRLYVSRLLEISYHTQITDNGCKRWIKMFKEELEKNNMYLCQTPLVAYSSYSDEESECVSLEEADNNIISNIEGMNRVGFNTNQVVDFSKWIGHTYSEIEEEDILSDYMHSFRFKEDITDRSQVYRSILNIDVKDQVKIYLAGIDSNISDYLDKCTQLEMHNIVCNKLKSSLSFEVYFGIEYVYLWVGNRKYRMYTVSESSYYPLISKDGLISLGLSNRDSDFLINHLPDREHASNFWSRIEEISIQK